MHSSYGEGLETDRTRRRYRASPLPDIVQLGFDFLGEEHRGDAFQPGQHFAPLDLSGENEVELDVIGDPYQGFKGRLPNEVVEGQPEPQRLQMTAGLNQFRNRLDRFKDFKHGDTGRQQANLPPDQGSSDPVSFSMPNNTVLSIIVRVANSLSPRKIVSGPLRKSNSYP